MILTKHSKYVFISHQNHNCTLMFMKGALHIRIIVFYNTLVCYLYLRPLFPTYTFYSLLQAIGIVENAEILEGVIYLKKTCTANIIFNIHGNCNKKNTTLQKCYLRNKGILTEVQFRSLYTININLGLKD